MQDRLKALPALTLATLADYYGEMAEDCASFCAAFVPVGAPSKIKAMAPSANDLAINVAMVA